MITLINIYQEENRHAILYSLLSERTTDQSISHKAMPTYQEHVDFVDSKPYYVWCFVHSSDEDDYVGAVYIGKHNELGVFIFQIYQRKGYGSAAIKSLISQFEPLPAIRSVRAGNFIANISPHNTASKKMFEALGFERIQETYKYG